MPVLWNQLQQTVNVMYESFPELAPTSEALITLSSLDDLATLPDSNPTLMRTLSQGANWESHWGLTNQIGIMRQAVSFLQEQKYHIFQNGF